MVCDMQAACAELPNAKVAITKATVHADAILPSAVADRGVTVLRCFQPLSHRFPLCVFLSAHLDHQASQLVGLWALPLRP